MHQWQGCSYPRTHLDAASSSSSQESIEEFLHPDTEVEAVVAVPVFLGGRFGGLARQQHILTIKFVCGI